MSKYCQHCGAEVQDSSVFCEHCGKNLTEAVVTENHQPQKDEKRCRTCGNVFSKYLRECPYCGAGSIQLIPAKLTKCKKCNQNMAENVMQCPHCGKRTATFYIVRAAIAIVAICFLYLFTSFLMFKPKTQTPSNPNVEQNINTEQQNNILYSDSFFDIEYMNLYDVDLVNTSYLQLKVINNSNQKVTLLLDDVYVNDIVVQSGTALPIELEPGKISTTPFILFSGNTGLSAEDITKIEFKLTARDDNFNLVHTTSKITINK